MNIPTEVVPVLNFASPTNIFPCNFNSVEIGYKCIIKIDMKHSKINF